MKEKMKNLILESTCKINTSEGVVDFSEEEMFGSNISENFEIFDASAKVNDNFYYEIRR
jgi:hypothetical protein